MFFEYFISKRLSFQTERPFSRIIVRLAISAIVLSLLVIITSVSIVQGFKNEIQSKIIGFGSHIQIIDSRLQNNFENKPVLINEKLIDSLYTIDGIRHVQLFAHKPAILRTEDDIEGAVFKGVGKEFDWDYFQRYMDKGESPGWDDDEAGNRVVLSAYIADRLQLGVGDDIVIYFIDDPPRALRPEISGIYSTGVREIDKRFIIGDLRHIQRINVWDENEAGGYEIAITDFDRINEINQSVRRIIPYDLTTLTIHQIYPQIFDWLGLIDMNVIIILALMIIVAAINMITALLIMILERTRMIGLFKALGATNGHIRRIFIMNASWMILKGMLIGNAIGIAFIYLQNRYQFITLDPENYYVDHVPVEIGIGQLVLLNAGTLMLCTLALYLPSWVISRVQPSRSLRFE